jgi:hypothetical protein
MPPSYSRALLAALALAAGGCASIQTQVTINAPASAVRTVLYDVDSYPQWNPFILKLAGPVVVGGDSAVTVKPVGKGELSGKVTFVAVNDSTLAWRGGLGFPGLYSGRHEFVLEAVGPNQTIVHQNEKMQGAVLPFIDLRPLRAGFVAMNDALKARVAKQAGP